jgi:hypothetical protein
MHVSRDESEPVHFCRGSEKAINHREGVRYAESSPSIGDATIDRKNSRSESRANCRKPMVESLGLVAVDPAFQLDSAPQLSDYEDTGVKRHSREGAGPVRHSCISFLTFAEFRITFVSSRKLTDPLRGTCPVAYRYRIFIRKSRQEDRLRRHRAPSKWASPARSEGSPGPFQLQHRLP